MSLDSEYNLADVLEIYNNMIEDFKTHKSKSNLISMMTNYCANARWDDIFILKKKLEINFSKDVNCTYSYLNTPKDYGCDIREIFFDRDNELIDGGEELLQLLTNKWNDTNQDQVYHILTDIDDTLYPNTQPIMGFDTYIAGSDNSWHQHTPYPGIKAFYNQFYKQLPEMYRYSTILSATPGMLKMSKLNDKHNKLKPILHDYGFLHGENQKSMFIAPENISSLIQNFQKNNNSQKQHAQNISQLHRMFGETKIERFKQYKRIFPEYKFIFIGDNGQGDVIAGEKMVEFDSKCLVYIHQVSVNGTHYKEGNVSHNLSSEQSKRIGFFKTYHELGNLMRRKGILTRQNHKAITKTFKEDLASSPVTVSRLYNQYTRVKPKKNKSTKRLKINIPTETTTARPGSPSSVLEFSPTQMVGGKKRTRKPTKYKGRTRTARVKPPSKKKSRMVTCR